jgi:hypothetical protein
MKQPPKSSSAPPIDVLRRESQEVHEDELEPVNPEEFAFHVGGSYFHLKPRLVVPSWRHRLYWALRSLIDWIHP